MIVFVYAQVEVYHRHQKWYLYVYNMYSWFYFAILFFSTCVDTLPPGSTKLIGCYLSLTTAYHYYMKWEECLLNIKRLEGSTRA